MKNDTKKTAQVSHFDLYGSRDNKYEFLHNNSLKSVNWNELKNDAPNYFFVKKDFTGSGLYEAGIKIEDLFTLYNIGIATGNDSKLISIDSKILEIEFLIKPVNYSYRPFDNRYTIFDKTILQRARYDVMKHLLKPNLSLQITSQNRQLSLGYIFISNCISDRHLLDSAADSMSVFPLYLYPEKDSKTASRTPNLNSEIVQKIADGLGLKFTNEKESDSGAFAPIDILDYIYAVLHSPTYREKYKEFLKIDFPRVPYPKDKETFWKLVRLGGELRQIHLLESPAVEKYITKYPADGDNVVNKIKYQDGKVYINDTQHFANVPEVAWSFFIGGYQPAQKWLKDRKGRKLEFDDILHYQKIIVALTETDRIMKEVDKVEVE